MDASLPTIDGKYQLVRRLGEGGMGAVYEARHTGTGRRCALKVIASEALAKSPDIVERFRREAMASGAIESQYIAHVLDTGVDAASGSPYLVMELLVGEDVHLAMKRLGALPPDLALRICAQACLGLQKAHDAGIVHRDVKPANLFLATRDRGEIVVKVLDFGIAKVKLDHDMSLANAGGALTRTGTMLGSPLYMSPEQALGKKSTDHRTDLWSLGVVLYEMLTGAAPCADVTTVGQLIMQICSQPPRNVQDHAGWVSPAVAAIVHKALAMDASARFQSAAEMLAAIEKQLPAGFALNESLFVEMSARTRSIPAPRFGVPTESIRPPQPSVGDAPATLVEPQRKIAPTTTAGFGHSWRPPSSARAPRTSRVAVAAIFASITAAAFGGALMVLNGAAPAAATSSASPSTPAVAEVPASTGAPSASLAVAPSAAASASSVPAAPSTPAKPSRAASPAGARKDAPTSRAPTATVASPPPAAPAPATPGPSCNPPYTLDAAGNKHFKPECF